MSRAIWLVLDSLGLGAAPDADRYGDAGSDTFGHIAAACAEAARGPLRLPELTRMGLPQAYAALHGAPAAGFSALPEPDGYYGHAMEAAAGKDTLSGHWETMGVVLSEPFSVFEHKENSFPDELVQALITQGGVPGFLGNCHASGTEILDRLGAEHLRSGCPILYTSADSVLQIAAHEQTFGVARLHALCELARELLAPYQVGRVIARPFIGSVEEGFRRTGNRRDYALPPPAPTLLEIAENAGREVIAVGKLSDIFAGRGVTRHLPGKGIDGVAEATLQAMAEAPAGALIASNFVDFDSEYGHRRDPLGYGTALETFDAHLTSLRAALRPGDLLLISADHGCDPTWPGSDHTRECVPVLVFGPGLGKGYLGGRHSFADLGQTLASHLSLPPLLQGHGFL